MNAPQRPTTPATAPEGAQPAAASATGTQATRPAAASATGTQATQPAAASATAPARPQTAPAMPDSPDRLWPQDPGTLSRDARRALVELIKGPYVSAGKPAVWRAILNSEEVLRSRLADLFLELIVDEAAGVAFVRNVEHPEADAPAVVRTHTLTLIDSALLLHLRQELLRVDRGQRAIIGKDEAFDALAVYGGPAGTDEPLLRKRFNAAFTKMQDYGILQRTPTEDRFEISPVLRIIFGADQIRALSSEYERVLREHGVEAADHGVADEADDGSAEEAEGTADVRERADTAGTAGAATADDGSDAAEEDET